MGFNPFFHRPAAAFGKPVCRLGLAARGGSGLAPDDVHRALGAVSLIGPVRMDYEKALGAVRSAASELSRFAESVYGER